MTVLISQSTHAHHLETVNCHLILNFTFTHCVVTYLYDIITIPNTCMSLIHIHVSTCEHVPTSIGHVTIPKQMLPQFLSALVNLGVTTLLHTHG